MKKILINLAFIVAIVACSKEEELIPQLTYENNVTFTVGVAEADQTRITSQFPEGESWPFLWEQDDKLTAQAVYGSAYSSNEFTMSSFSQTQSQFQGVIPTLYDYFALAHTYNQTPVMESGLCTVNLTEQDGTLNKTFMSSDKIAYSANVASTAKSLYHRGAFMVIEIAFTNGNSSDVTLDKISYQGLNTYGKFDMLNTLAWSDQQNISPIEVTLAEPISVATSTTTKRYLNFIPTTLVKDSELKITFSFSDKKERTFTSVITDDVVSFLPGHYYTSTITCDMDTVTDQQLLFENGPFIATTKEYTIKTADHLRSLATLTNDGTLTTGEYTFTLIDNIDLAHSAWSPIGTTEYPFRETFNGAGYEISGIDINDEKSDYKALFGYISGSISNLTVSGSVIGDQYVGGIAAYTTGGTLSNCNSKVTVVGNEYVGGVVGFASDDSKLSSCSNLSSVIGDYRVGGVTGYCYYSRLSMCYNTAVISGRESVGGVSGDVERWSVMNDCYNRGTVNGSGTKVGGLTGVLTYYATATNSYNTGAINGDSNVGGLTGMISDTSTLYNSYNAGGVTNNYNNAGGIAGNVTGSSSATKCYWATDVADAPLYGVSLDMSSNCDITAMFVNEMKLESFVAKLNNIALKAQYSLCNWIQSEAGNTLPELILRDVGLGELEGIDPGTSWGE